MQFNKSKFNKGTFNTLDFIAYLALAQLNGSSYITTTSIRTQHTLSLINGKGDIVAVPIKVRYLSSSLDGGGTISGSVVRTTDTDVFLDGEGNIVAIPYAIYMPPFMTTPTRFLIIDTVTLAVIEDTKTKVVFI